MMLTKRCCKQNDMLTRPLESFFHSFWMQKKRRNQSIFHSCVNTRVKEKKANKIPVMRFGFSVSERSSQQRKKMCQLDFDLRNSNARRTKQDDESRPQHLLLTFRRRSSTRKASRFLCATSKTGGPQTRNVHSLTSLRTLRPAKFLQGKGCGAWEIPKGIFRTRSVSLLHKTTKSRQATPTFRQRSFHLSTFIQSNWLIDQPRNL